METGTKKTGTATTRSRSSRLYRARLFCARFHRARLYRPRPYRPSHMRVRGVGELAALHLGGEMLDGAADVLGQLGVVFHEFGVESLVQAEHVVEDEDLPVAVRARTDPDRRNRDAGRDTLGGGGSHELEHQGA